MDMDIMDRQGQVAILEVKASKMEHDYHLEKAYNDLARQARLDADMTKNARERLLTKRSAEEVDSAAEHLAVFHLAVSAATLLNLHPIVGPVCTLITDEDEQKPDEEGGCHFIARIIDRGDARLDDIRPVTVHLAPCEVGENELARQMDYIVKGSAHTEGAYRIVPELTDEWVRTNIPGLDSVDAFSERVRDDMLKRKRDNIEQAKPMLALTTMSERLEMTIPDEAVDRAYDEAYTSFLDTLAGSGMALETYLADNDMTAEELKVFQRGDCETQIRCEVTLELIAEKKSCAKQDVITWLMQTTDFVDGQ